jgi:hypothetical protein
MIAIKAAGGSSENGVIRHWSFVNGLHLPVVEGTYQ